MVAQEVDGYGRGQALAAVRGGNVGSLDERFPGWGFPSRGHGRSTSVLELDEQSGRSEPSGR